MSALIETSVDHFYFGPPHRRLFGALHEAQTYAQREFGFVICYPFGQEYLRSHRACRHLAQRLAQAGFPVLRFDYGGTGDSSGDAESADLAIWREDIRRAIDLLRDRTGIDAVGLAGVMLGASMSVQIAADNDDVEALILWEPVVVGSSYLADLAEQHQELLWRFFDNANELAASSAAEYLGFPVGATLRDDLERLNLLSVPVPRAEHTLIVESGSSVEIAQMRDRWRGLGQQIDYRQVPSFTVWHENVDKGLVPEQVLRAIVSWASEVLP